MALGPGRVELGVAAAVGGVALQKLPEAAEYFALVFAGKRLGAKFQRFVFQRPEEAHRDTHYLAKLGVEAAVAEQLGRRLALCQLAGVALGAEFFPQRLVSFGQFGVRGVAGHGFDVNKKDSGKLDVAEDVHKGRESVGN